MTETSPMCCLSIPPREATPEEGALAFEERTAGAGHEVRLVDDAGQPCRMTA